MNGNKRSVIELHDLCKDYPGADGPTPVLKNINIDIQSGEFVAIMGPSGSGKSTLMNVLGCLDTATSGQYLLSDQNINLMNVANLAQLRNRFIGFVFQGFNLLPRSSLLDNVAMPLIYAGVPLVERRARAQLMLNKVGLGSRASALPSQISGGQQQRVAIARALVNEPALILADEPTGNLDSSTSSDIMGLFTELNRKDGITLVLVTHEADIAAYAQRLIRLVDGHKVHDGDVETGLAQAMHIPTTGDAA
ncbi:MAG: ABC transporter ATP-binding protein [Moraxellaceae bacterium]|nr:ABC transporter ATP-binding protein [Moraxellaceae bacterium]MDZ4386883.1 ABC transporter ATP-binding protein [Moraxellaceae bacterium]